MPLILNLRLLTKETLELQGELPPSDFDFGLRDEMIQVNSPVTYDLKAELLDDALLIQGSLRVLLECECVRCLKRFSRPLELDALALHLPLEGEEAVSVDNDNVDLTPFLREDMLLEFPQHPLCEPDCPGLKKTDEKQVPKTGKKPESEASAWAELNKLKL
jgi:uncharacterized metal-binding protein YceD (DUF177 family)